MFCQAGFDQWLRTIMQHLPHLSKPQATVLAWGSFGMVLARSCALPTVRHLLAKGLKRKEQTVRQQLRAWYDAPRGSGVPSATHSTSRPVFPSCWAGSSAGGRARHWRGPSLQRPWGHGAWCWRSVASIAAARSRSPGWGCLPTPPMHIKLRLSSWTCCLQ